MRGVLLPMALCLLLIETPHAWGKLAGYKGIVPPAKLSKSDEMAKFSVVNYDDYPMVVPKRAAMLLDRLMVALHHALEKGDGEDGAGRPINKVYRDGRYSGKPTVALISAKNQPPPPPPPPLPPSKTEQLMKSYYAEADADADAEDRVTNSIPDEIDDIEARKELLDEMMDIQTRGTEDKTKKGRYWKCYFNAVSCF
uniref:Allatostatin CC n=1 Tax=Anopheles atroparvus TaxID=41427 RepID=A0A182IS40_ANOAO